MRYTKSDLHSLAVSTASGDAQGCGPGSAAGGVYECAVGVGDNEGQCDPNGSGASAGCYSGGTASDFPVSECEQGGNVGGYCFVGTGD